MPPSLNDEIEEFLTGAAGVEAQPKLRILNVLMCSCGYLRETVENEGKCNNCKTPMKNIGWIEKA